MERRQKKLDAVQVLRALAVLAVVVHHLGAIELKYSPLQWLGFPLAHGLYGVDLFFVISGFIITYTALPRMEAKGAWMDFIRHRAARIYPLYWLFTLLVLAVYLVRPEWVNNAYGTPDILGSFLLLADQNHLLLTLGWTLTFELYFYLVFSVLFPLGKKMLPLLWVVWAATIAYGMAAVPPLDARGPVLNVIASPLVFEFILGSMVGALALQKHLMPKLAVPALLLAGVYLLIVKDAALALPSLAWSRTALMAVPCALLLYACVSMEGVFERKGWQPLVLIGNASYSIYLSHILVLSAFGRFTTPFAQQPGPVLHALWLLAGLGMALGIGIATYLLVEKPLLARLRQRCL